MAWPQRNALLRRLTIKVLGRISGFSDEGSAVTFI